MENSGKELHDRVTAFSFAVFAVSLGFSIHLAEIAGGVIRPAEVIYYHRIDRLIPNLVFPLIELGMTIIFLLSWYWLRNWERRKLHTGGAGTFLGLSLLHLLIALTPYLGYLVSLWISEHFF